MRVDRCNNIGDFRSMARRRLPGPIFHYIDGAADDEVTYRRNTEAYERCDLVPNVLAGVESIDMSVTVMGQKIDMPLFCAPTALQRLFHHDGERAVAKAAEKFGTMFGISSLGTISIEEIGSTISTPKLFQLYFHKDRGLTNSMIERCIAANFDVLALTVDTITGGNRERDLRTGFTSPPRLTLNSLLSFAMHPRWAANYFMHEKFELPQLKSADSPLHALRGSTGFRPLRRSTAVRSNRASNVLRHLTKEGQARRRHLDNYGGPANCYPSGFPANKLFSLVR